jgi:hypothetical protein
MNVFTNLPIHLPDECVEVLQSSSNVRIERIISQGHSTPVGESHEMISKTTFMKGLINLISPSFLH